jgi:predicted nucleic acid-binding protein
MAPPYLGARTKTGWRIVHRKTSSATGRPADSVAHRSSSVTGTSRLRPRRINRSSGKEVPGLMRAHGLHSYDAVHAASLVLAEIGDIATLDHGFAAMPQNQVSIHTTSARVATMRRWRGGS